MDWDDHDGQDFTTHIHPCWLTKSLVELCEPHIPVFLSNDLEPIDTCFPLELVIKKSGCVDVEWIEVESCSTTTIGRG